jgi:hypothetical protein
MLKSCYRSSLAALAAGVAVFSLSIAAMRAFDLSGELVFAPGLVLQRFLNALGADLPQRAAVATTLLAWCLVADGVLLVLRRPWRAAAHSGTGSR